MDRPIVHTINRRITIKNLRDFITDNCIAEGSTIHLHPQDFDSVILESRETYGEPLDVPYYLVGCYVIEDRNFVPRGKVGITS